MMATDNNIMNWDDTIENDGQEFVVLPEGDYTFTVTDLERGRFPGSAKLPACSKATLTVFIDNDLGPATARFDLILCRTLEWKLASFFRCIGLKKQGEKITMDWNAVPGSRGRAHIRPRSYTARSGEERRVNEVVRFYDYDLSMDFGKVEDPEELPW